MPLYSCSTCTADLHDWQEMLNISDFVILSSEQIASAGLLLKSMSKSALSGDLMSMCVGFQLFTFSWCTSCLMFLWTILWLAANLLLRFYKVPVQLHWPPSGCEIAELCLKTVCLLKKHNAPSRISDVVCVVQISGGVMEMWDCYTNNRADWWTKLESCYRCLLIIFGTYLG